MSEAQQENRPQPPLDYNFPTPNRKDLMSLSTLTSKDFPMKKFKQIDTKRDWSVNLYNLDIGGTCPRRIGALNHKIDFINKTDDIDRSCPKLLHVGLNKPEYNLRNDDIEFSVPGCVKIKTNRHVNPLEPRYQLPKTEQIPFDIPKFIRDPIPVDDIDGAKPRKIMSKWVARDNLRKDDIKGASTKQPYIRNCCGNRVGSKTYHSIDYRDVTNTEFKSGRMTNPLEPVYKLGYYTGEKVTIGPIEKNKPQTLSKFVYEDPFNLKVNDIKGSAAGSKNYINRFNGKNFIYTSSDIFGAQADTLKRGIVTTRHLHPLMPKYKFLGAEELKGTHENDPYDNRKRKAFTTVPGKKSDKIKTPTSQGAAAEGEKKPEPEKVPAEAHPSAPETSRGAKEKLELEDLPYVEDKVIFDKDKFVRPKPFYGYLHDQYLIPENITGKSSLSPQPKQTTEGFASKTKLENILGKTSPSRDSGLGTTYAQKLDDFMTKNNMKLVEPSL